MKTKLQISKSYWFIVVAYLILIGPLALDFNFYYPDEVHYSDAAIEMLQNGDLLTPYQGSGDLRFNKPIVTYWIVLLGIKLFGTTAFAIRFFFLLAGAGILILVYYASKNIYSEEKVALLSTTITVSNITFLMSTMRAIPDILLCLFIALSLLGFTGFLRFGDKTPPKYHWMLFTGMAIAFEVKGIPALIIGAIAIVFLLFNPWNRIRLKKLLHWPSLVTSVIIGLFWFIVMYFHYKDLFIQSFYNDQVGERVTTNYLNVLGNLGLSVGLMIGLLFPWITFLPLKTNCYKPEKKAEKAFQAFAIASIVLFIFLSGTVFKFYDRYLLPLVPIWSVWLAALIFRNTKKKSWLITFWGILAVLVHVILLSFALTISVTLGESFLHYLWLLAGLAITTFILYQLFYSKNLIWLALTIPLIAYNLTLITHTISFPGEGQQIAKILKAQEIPQQEEIGFVGNRQIASKLRVAGKGKYRIINISNLYAEYESENYNILIVSQQDLYLFPEKDYEKLGNSVSWSSYESSELIHSLFVGNYRQQLAIRGKKYYVIRRLP